MATKAHTQRLGALNVTCKCTGTAEQPWSGRTVYKYRVKVQHSMFKASSYSADAYGSQNDYEHGNKERCDQMGAMIVDELLSAAADPDEFLTMVVGEEKGREALKKAKNAEKVIKAAKKFRYEELSQAVEEAQEKGLL